MKYWNFFTDPANWQNFADSPFGKGFITALIAVLVFMIALLIIRAFFSFIFRTRRCSTIEIQREDGNTIVNREVIFSMVERELGAYPALSADKIVLTRKGKKYQLTIYCAYLLSDQAGVPAFCDEFKPKLLSALEKGFGIADLEEIRLWICNPDENSTPADKEPGLVQEKDAYIGL